MDWSHYRQQGQELFTEATNTTHQEANWRSCISRVYYGTFHEAKQKAQDKWNVSFSQSGSVHGEVQNYFKQMGEKAIARKLKRMREARNKADYDDLFPDLKEEAKNTLKLAQEVIAQLGKL